MVSIEYRRIRIRLCGGSYFKLGVIILIGAGLIGMGTGVGECNTENYALFCGGKI